MFIDNIYLFLAFSSNIKFDIIETMSIKSDKNLLKMI